MKKVLIFTMAALLMVCGLQAGDKALKKAVKSEHRGEENKARDAFRKPYETLAFFGIEKDMTVIEIWPGSGWYSEIIAPYLKNEGKLIAAVYDRNPETARPWMLDLWRDYEANLVKHPERNGEIEVVDLSTNGDSTLAPEGSVDMILDFRNAHNWIRWGGDAMAAGWFKVLKPGGVVGIVDHHLADDKTYNPKNGYIHEKQIIELMEKHGFVLAARSDHLANPKDTMDHPQGVWTLPPTLALGEQDRDTYVKIGESNRMALKFVKPK